MLFRSLFKDVLLFHWKEESQHAILDELEWRREDANLSDEERDAAVDDLIALVAAMDGLLQVQARADADYFLASATRTLKTGEQDRIREGVLKAYRWQYIGSGVSDPRFTGILASMTTDAQRSRIGAALVPLVG